MSFGGAFLILIAGASQVPGLLIGMWRWKSGSITVTPMLIGAYLVAFTGVGVYAFAASQTEPSDSVNSAAHMHLILFPLMHCVLAVLLYLICGLASGLIVLVSQLSKRS